MLPAGAGEIAVRKAEAAHIADRILNQSLVMTNWSTGAQSGMADEGSGRISLDVKEPKLAAGRDGTAYGQCDIFHTRA